MKSAISITMKWFEQGRSRVAEFFLTNSEVFLKRVKHSFTCLISKCMASQAINREI